MVKTMILAIECIVICLIFCIAVVVSTVVNKEFWLHCYPLEAQEKYKKEHPEYMHKSKNIPAILIFYTVCIAVMAALIYLAGARDFITGTRYTFIIWICLMVADYFGLDFLVFGHWKKIRLPGTEHMNKEYHTNAWQRHNIKKRMIAVIAGIPLSCICAAILILIV